MKKYLTSLVSVFAFVCLVRTHPTRCPEKPAPQPMPVQPNNFVDGRRDAITPDQAAEIAAHFGNRDPGEDDE